MFRGSEYYAIDNIGINSRGNKAEHVGYCCKPDFVREFKWRTVDHGNISGNQIYPIETRKITFYIYKTCLEVKKWKETLINTVQQL